MKLQAACFFYAPLLAAVLSSGCASGPGPAGDALTAEAARAALIQLVENDPKGFRADSLVALRRDAAVPFDEDEISIGHWMIDLKKQRFSLDVGGSVWLLSHQGHFETQNGFWTAIVDQHRFQESVIKAEKNTPPSKGLAPAQP